MGYPDAPDWFVVIFGIVPFHIGCALGGLDKLVGYSTAAVICQSVMLVLLLAGAFFVFRSPKYSVLFKIFYLPVGYPLVTATTNIIPCLL